MGAMSITLYGHPFSSYVQKVLIALYENQTAFEWRMLDGADSFAELRRIWPIGLMPVLLDSGRPVAEASIIVEHLQLEHAGPARLIPDDPRTALEVRFLDRFFDNHVQTPMQKIVGDALRKEGEKDPRGVADARARLDAAYGWLDERMAGRPHAAGEDFTLADAAAAPALFYADWAHPIPEALANVRSYRERLNARASFARAVDEARPFRHFFPLGAPDRD
jgi:glutathione S-transferase